MILWTDRDRRAQADFLRRYLERTAVPAPAPPKPGRFAMLVGRLWYRFWRWIEGRRRLP